MIGQSACYLSFKTLLCVVLVASFNCAWSANSTSGNGEQIFTIVECDGSYTKVSTSSRTPLVRGTYGTYSAPASRFDGCLIQDLIDGGSNVLFALMPTTARLDNSGIQRFNVVALDRKSLRTVHQYALPNTDSSFPTLFLDSIQQDLIVLMNNGGALQRIHINPDGALVDAGPAVQLQAPIVSSPYVNDQSQIVGGNRVFDAQGRLIREIESDSIMTPELKSRLAPMLQAANYRVGDSSKTLLSNALEESAAGGRITYMIGGDTEPFRSPAAGIVVYDLHRGPIASFVSPFPVVEGFYGKPTLHLTPNGHSILFEKYEWLTADGKPSKPSVGSSQAQIAKTGVLSFYNADAGTLIGTIVLEKVPRYELSRTFINFSSDSRYLYYWFGNQLYVIDVDTSQVLFKRSLPEGADPQMVIADSGSHLN